MSIIPSPLSLLGGAPWKLATIGAGVIAAILGFMLFTANMENKHLSKDKKELIARIEDPKTGYVARLTQANANVVTLKDAVEKQNVALKQRGVEAEATRKELERLRAQLTVAQGQTRQAEARLRAFMATKPQGGSLDARVRDIDARILKDLN